MYKWNPLANTKVLDYQGENDVFMNTRKCQTFLKEGERVTKVVIDN